MAQVIYVGLSNEAHEKLSSKSNFIRLDNANLRLWLIRYFEQLHLPTLTSPSLFDIELEVEDDILILLQALSQISQCTVGELVETWVLDSGKPIDLQNLENKPEKGRSGNLTQETLEQVAQILNLAETLLTGTVADAKQKLGGEYPEGEKVAKTATEVFSVLRELLGIEIER